MIKISELIEANTNYCQVNCAKFQFRQGYWITNKNIFTGAIILTDEIEQPPPNKIDLEGDIAAGKPKDKLVYIYTSGTTGMPKAAVITNLR